MNGFELTAAAYRKAAETGEITKNQAEKHCKVFDFLASCDDEDIFNLFDSSAFNEIAKSYMRLAVNRLIANETLDEEQGIAVRNEFSYLFDEKERKRYMKANVYKKRF